MPESFLSKAETASASAPETWLAAIESSGSAQEEATALDAGERRDELLMMGLRLTEGVARPRFLGEVGADIEAALDGERLRPLQDGGFLVLDANGLRATAAGRQRLNAVLAALLA